MRSRSISPVVDKSIDDQTAEWLRTATPAVSHFVYNRRETSAGVDESVTPMVEVEPIDVRQTPVLGRSSMGAYPLALAIMFVHKTYGADLQRAFAIWALYRMHVSWAFLDDMVEFISAYTGRHPTTVRRWLKAGVQAGFFEQNNVYGRPALFIVGLKRVEERWLNKNYPGVVVHVSVEHLLNPSLQHLRAVMLFTLTAKKPRRMSHIFMANHIGRCMQTTRNYYNAVKIRRVYGWVVYETFNGQPAIVNQLPNIYDGTYLYHTRTDNPSIPWDKSLSKYIVTQPRDTRFQKRYFYHEWQAKAAFKRLCHLNLDHAYMYYNIETPPGWNDKHQYMGRYPAPSSKDIPMGVRLARLRRVMAEITHVDELPTLREAALMEVLYSHPDRAVLLNDYEIPDVEIPDVAVKPSRKADKVKRMSRQYVPFRRAKKRTDEDIIPVIA